MKLIKYFFQFVIIITLLLLFRILGLKIASFISNKIASSFGPFFRSKNLIKSNILKALPHLSSEELDKISKKMWKNYGRILAEYVFIKNFRGPKFNNNIKVKGQDVLEKIKKDNEPVIFVSGHFNNFELMALHIEKSGINLAAIYRPLNNKFLNYIMERVRKKYICKNQIKKGLAGVKNTINYIQNNFSIALMIDQRVSEGKKLPFFEHMALTTTLPAQLATKYQLQIVPIYISRNKNDEFEMEIFEPITSTNKENSETNKLNLSIKLNKITEQMISRDPGQWIWTHNRWK